MEPGGLRKAWLVLGALGKLSLVCSEVSLVWFELIARELR